MGSFSHDLSRDLIKHARQGGILLKERREKLQAAQKDGAQNEKERKESAKKQLAASQSAPALGKTTSSSSGTRTGALTAGARRGGGWVKGEGADADGIASFKKKLTSFLEGKGDIDFCEKPFHRTALWEAASKNHEGLVKMLVANGASVSTDDYQGRTPLHEAALYGHANLVDFLLDSGHPIDCVDAFGQTPLFHAVKNGRHDVVQRLIERKAQTNLLDSDGVTVQEIAAFQGMPAMAQFLLYKGAFKHRLPGDKDSSGLRSSYLGRSLSTAGALVLGGQSAAE